MERLRRMRTEVVERTVRRQTQLEKEFFAHKLAIQDSLQQELSELENEVLLAATANSDKSMV
jgi:hypothetical protein